MRLRKKRVFRGMCLQKGRERISVLIMIGSELFAMKNDSGMKSAVTTVLY